MRRMMLGMLSLSALQLGAALAEEQPVFEVMPVLDLSEVSPEMAEDMFGRWTIADESGDKTCVVELRKEETIGGMEIEVDSGCEAVFPVMGDITAWRLLEGWAIDLADGERHTRVRFTTPDERYVAYHEIDGIFTIAPTLADEAKP